MRILLTGSSGSVGRAVLKYLLEQEHTVVGLDLVAPPKTSTYSAVHLNLEQLVIDLGDYRALDRVFQDKGPFDGVIHLSATPNPLNRDSRDVHNNNVVSGFNVLETASRYGVRRLVQASSVNAPGLRYTPEGRQRFESLPLTETMPMRPMDPYALSKQWVHASPSARIEPVRLTFFSPDRINELQAHYIARKDPRIRIASLRLHYVLPDTEQAAAVSCAEDIFSWVSHRSCAEACLLGLTSEGWEGSEIFNIVAPEICWVGGKSIPIPGHQELSGEVATLELLRKSWGDRIEYIDESYWANAPRRSPWSTLKAQTLLGWQHL